MWLWLTRIAALLHLTVAAKNLKEIKRREEVEINPNRIYNSHEAAHLLQLERIQLLSLLKAGKIGGKLVRDNYRITGTSLMEYLNHEI